MLDRYDSCVPAIRNHLPVTHTFFRHLRALAKYMSFASWGHVGDFMLRTLWLAQPPPSARLLRAGADF